MLLYGGRATIDGPTLGDTWTWDGTSWKELQVPGASSRAYATMARHGSTLVLFGGYDGYKVLGDTWLWNGVAWSQVMLPGPAARADAMMTTPL